MQIILKSETMVYKVRVLLDVEGDVFRDIILKSDRNLEDFHLIIAKSFGFKGQEMASFYISDKDWNQGEEIPLFDMSEGDNDSSMAATSISTVLNSKGDRLIYIYDFFSMWTFFVELVAILPSSPEKLPFVSLAIGQVPEEAPEKQFIGDFSMESIDDMDEFNENAGFENIDDLDPDSY